MPREADKVEVRVEDFMPIRITHLDKKSASTQHAEISRVIDNVRLVSRASYTALAAAFGVLYGSI